MNGLSWSPISLPPVLPILSVLPVPPPTSCLTNQRDVDSGGACFDNATDYITNESRA
jgi:hypothetical protein